MGTAAFNYYQANRDRFLQGLTSLLKIPSVSTLPEHKPDVRRAAEFVAEELRSMGIENAEIIDGKEDQNPLVYAEWLGAQGKPTLLVYGHYDVQPPDPLEEWISPPFEPAVRDQNIYARGAVDDKGQTYLLLKALEGFMKTDGALPINVKFLIEGEEEVGGEHIEQYVPKNQEKLRADAALICEAADLLARMDRLAPPPGRQSAHHVEALFRGEVRVLRYLQTNLYAREIAGELSITVNTVKTHQRHLHQKLGARSRTQAVEQARALGLLTPSARATNTESQRYDFRL